MNSFRLRSLANLRNYRVLTRWNVTRLASTEPQKETTEHPGSKLQIPDVNEKTYSDKIENLVKEISQLNLIEVSELNTLLKKRLNLPDAPVAPVGGTVAAAPDAGDEEEAAPKAVKSIFTVKLMKFDEKQKVALIKEIKNLTEGMNLVQAKKFVESAPTILKADISKDEAEKLKEAIEKVGGVIEIE